MSLGPGSLVTPNVRLLDTLGEGGMGAVWIAEHLALDTHVAVKLINPALLAEKPSLVERFKREARAAARIRSSHVVQVFDQGVTEGGVPYIVMELLEGESLGQRLEERGRLEIPECAEIITGVAKALAAAHKVEIIHRDVKPDNIHLGAVDERLLVKVLDFGVAKQLQSRSEQLTVDGAIVGTPEYMCRDQMLDHADVSTHADLWSMAVVAYQCFTGRLPFVGDTVPAICAKVVAARFEPPSTHRSELTPEVDAWFARALHRDPEQRFHNPKDMARELVRALPTESSALEDELESTGRFRALAGVTPADGGTPPSLREPSEDAGAGEASTAGSGGSSKSHTLEGTVSRRPSLHRRPGIWVTVAAACAVIGAGAWVLSRGTVVSPAARPSPADAAQERSVEPSPPEPGSSPSSERDAHAPSAGTAEEGADAVPSASVSSSAEQAPAPSPARPQPVERSPRRQPPRAAPPPPPPPEVDDTSPEALGF